MVYEPPPGFSGPSSGVDLWSDEVLGDPHPTFGRLRDLGPAVWLEARGVVALPRFDGVRAALSDPRLSSARGVGLDARVNDLFAGTNMMCADGAEQAEMRKPLVRQLSAGRLARHRDEIAARVGQIVDEAVARSSFDVVEDLASRISVAVVGDLVGFDAAERCPHLDAASEQAFNTFGPPNGRLEAALGPLATLNEESVALAESGDLSPDGFGAELVAGGHARDLLYFLWPGVDTVTRAIASGTALLARHPDQWRILRGDPSLVRHAVREVLRLDTPIHYFTRVTTSSIDVDGVGVPPDTRVLIMYGSANRDERHFTDPERFDMTRNPSDHVAFGFGPHRCAGATLAEIVLTATLTALVHRVERFTVHGDPAPLLHNVLHGVRSLAVSAHRSRDHVASTPG